MKNEPNRLLDELAKLITEAGGIAKEFQGEARTLLQFQLERIFNKLDLVKREDYEILKQLVDKLQAESQSLKERIAALETQINKV